MSQVGQHGPATAGGGFAAAVAVRLPSTLGFMYSLAPVLAELKTIRHERADVSPFKDHIEFLRWSDRAEPLLSFSLELTDKFKDSVNAATAVRDWRPQMYVGAVQGAIEAVNKAITLLEMQIASESTDTMMDLTTQPLAAPEKLTIKWLYEHAPWSFYAWLFGALSVAFALGFQASEIRMAMYSKNVSSPAAITTAPTTANGPIVATKPTSTK